MTPSSSIEGPSSNWLRQVLAAAHVRRSPSMIHTRACLVLCLGLLASVPMFAAAAEPVATAMTSPLSIPRYKENPVYLFFESYILDVIGHLPRERSDGIQSMNLQKVFKTQASEWHAVLRETLGLSPTIDTAILDLWYRNQDLAKARLLEYSPQQFAMDFVDEYVKGGSQIDVWPPGALEAARLRIKAHRE